MKLWSGHLVSDLGSAVGAVALPLTAVITLGADVGQMSVLIALEQTPVLLFALFAGVWVDRLPRRPLIVAAEIGRGLLLATIPAAALMGALSMEQLYLVGFLAGTLKVLFDLASTSFLPSLVGRDELVDGNAKLQMSGAVADAGGRAAGGVLVKLLSAPLAIGIDAISFVLSGLVASFIRTPEPERASRASSPAGGVWGEIGEGMRVLLRTPEIRAMTIGSTIGSMGGAVQQTVFALYLTRELGVGPVWFGLVLAALGAAAFGGTFLARPAALRLGPGPAVIAGSLFWSAGSVILALVGPQSSAVLALLLLSQLTAGVGRSVASINQISLRQAITPDRVLGRVNASRRVLVFGVIPFGALLAGAIGEALGLRAALYVGAGIQVISFVYALCSPLRSVRTLPAPLPTG